MFHRPVSLSRLASVAVAVALGAFVCLGSSGCSAQKAQQVVDSAQTAVEKTSAAVQNLVADKAKIDDFIGKAQAGVSSASALDLLISALPADYQVTIRNAISQGQGYLATAAQVSQALGNSATTLLASLKTENDRLEAAKADLAKMKSSDDATWNVVQLGIGALASFVPALGAFVPILAAVRKKGQVDGATAVTNTVAAGRAADPAFSKLFDDGTPAAAAMKASLAALPDHIASAVDANKTQ